MRLVGSMLVLLAALPVCADSDGELRLAYRVDGVAMESVLVWDPADAEPRPGLIMVPNWMGIHPGQIAKAREIAAMGYVVLLADVYGVDTRPADAGQARAAASAMYADRPLLRQRARAALEQLRAQSARAPLDPARIGAIGFCFGGATVLELARDGAELLGVVSFHGNLSTSMPAQAGAIRAPILVLNGADDPLVPREQIEAFEAEMRAAGADWQFVNYGGAVHCFAESDAASPPNCLYDARAARRAFAAMQAFFAEAAAAP